ncbi:MAG: CheR family methyltransferase [Actinomycetota bacterium]|nr:CheR family methyltransferase [Actinomycetota bacterium]
MATKLHKLNDIDYARFRDFIAAQTGLHFSEKKRGALERGVLEALSKSGHVSIKAYFQALMQASDQGEMDRLVTLLTVGETYFYRDEGQFRLLQNDVLPKLISERMTTTKRLRIWSAGCASGEEPYSVAIILRELIPYLDTWETLILATDINRRSLEKAAEGKYSQWSFRTVPDTWLDKYFFLSPNNKFHLSDMIKNSVTFRHLNLKSNVYPSFVNNTSGLDLIICRNVAIYFEQETTGEIMNRFYNCLVDGGYLLMGASDPIPPADKFWTRNHSGAFIYQKKSQNFEIRQETRKSKPIKIQFSQNTVADKAKPIKPPAPVDLLAESQALLEMGQPVLAADKLAAKLQADPLSLPGLLLMAKIEVACGRLHEAGKWAERVIKADKLNVQAYYLLSAIHQGLGNDEKAIEALRKTIYLDKRFIAGHFSLGCLYKKQKRPAMAEKAFKNVVRLMVGRRKDEIVPETNGITYDKLLQVAEKNLEEKE